RSTIETDREEMTAVRSFAREVKSMTRKGLAVVVALAAAVCADTACAQFYKGKTITMIINYPAGGPTDIEGRIVAQHLPAHIAGKPTIVIKNVGGAGGVIGKDTPPGLKVATDIMQAHEFKALSLNAQNSNTINQALSLDLLGLKYRAIPAYR